MTIAERLTQHTPEILRQWEARVRVVVPSARHEHRSALLNSIPAFLEELAAALEHGGAAPPRGAPKAHAEQRVAQPEYSLQQVVREYSLLRGAVIDVLGASGPIEPADLRVILDTVDAAIAEAAAHYAELEARALRESEERFRLLVANVKDYAVYMLDPNGRIISWNHGAERITGYATEEILGKHLSIFYTEEEVREDRPRRVLEAAMRDGRFEGEGWHVRKNGTRFMAHLVINAVRNEDGSLRGFAQVAHDITERRALETELRKRAQALTEANRRKDEFLAMLGHELRNPLAPILTSLEILHLRPSRDPDTQRAHEIIERQARHLTRLVDDLLDVARITQGKVELRKEPIELKQLVNQVAETIRPFVEEREQRLAIAFPEATIWLEADPTRLSQALANLLHNSAKFTDRGGRIDVRVWIERGEAVVQVADTGAGIAPDLLPHIFDLFTQGSQPLDRAASGLGIGLTLVRRLVELHDGSVSAHSNGPGTGSEFVLRLPILRVNGFEKGAHRTPAAQSRARPKRVLVVDDNIDAAASLAMLLELNGHSVQVVHSGHEALRVALAERPEIVFLDIGLPDMHGYEVARRFRAESSLTGVQLVALTGYGQEQDKRHADAAGFEAHLTKPADLSALETVLSKAR